MIGPAPSQPPGAPGHTAMYSMLGRRAAAAAAAAAFIQVV